MLPTFQQIRPSSLQGSPSLKKSTTRGNKLSHYSVIKLPDDGVGHERDQRQQNAQVYCRHPSQQAPDQTSCDEARHLDGQGQPLSRGLDLMEEEEYI